MGTWTSVRTVPHLEDQAVSEPGVRAILGATGIALMFVLLTRWPLARTGPLDSDEFGFLREVAVRWFPMHHTLFKTLARLLGLILGDFYRGFILLDMIASALALVSLWWWLRARTSGAGGGRGPDAGGRPEFLGLWRGRGELHGNRRRRVVLDGSGDSRASPTDALASLRRGGGPGLGDGLSS